MAKPALGRGLGALLGGVPAKPAPIPAEIPTILAEAAAKGERVRHVALDRVRPSPFQPRKEFNAAALEELAESIRQQGIIQPLIVRDSGTHYELIAGERRWRAAALAGLAEVPVVVREADDRGVLELALIENLQRENLNPLEEALGYSHLIEQFNLRQEDAAAKVGKSRTVVANALRLLKLDAEVQAYLRDGRLSVGHAKVILALLGADQQKLATERVIKENLSVRQTEELVSRLQGQKQDGNPVPGKTTPLGIRDPNVSNVENRLRERLGTKVNLRYRQGKGSVEIRFFSDDELERILGIVGVKIE
jgi:ParB family chromosome partitioning protein